MPKIEIFECYRVTAGFDDEPAREMRPREVWFDEYHQLARPIERALALGCTVIVDRHRVDKFDHPNDSDLDDWPAERHFVRQEHTSYGWREIKK